MKKLIHQWFNQKNRNEEIKEAIISLLLNDNSTSETLYIFESVRMEIEQELSNRHVLAKNEINTINSYFRKEVNTAKISVNDAEYMSKPLSN